MIDKLPELVNGDDWLVSMGRHMDTTFLVGVGEDDWLVTVRDGRIESVEKGPHVMRSWSFALRAARETWDAYWKPVPASGDHELFALLRQGRLVIEGDMRQFMAYLLYLKLAMASPRRMGGAR